MLEDLKNFETPLYGSGINIKSFSNLRNRQGSALDTYQPIQVNSNIGNFSYNKLQKNTGYEDNLVTKGLASDNLENIVDLKAKIDNALQEGKSYSEIADEFIVDHAPEVNKNAISKDYIIISEDHNKGLGLYNPYTKTYGSKATRNFNPGNITGMSGKLLYGAVGISKSNVGDKGDRAQLVFSSPQAGFKAMHQLALNNYNNAPISVAFSKWQSDKNSFKNKLLSLQKAGVNINSKYGMLDKAQQKTFRKIWAQHEGYKGKFF